MKMVVNGQTTFHIDDIQPSWIDINKYRFIYNIIVSFLFGIIVGGISGYFIVRLTQILGAYYVNNVVSIFSITLLIVGASILYLGVTDVIWGIIYGGLFGFFLYLNLFVGYNMIINFNLIIFGFLTIFVFGTILGLIIKIFPIIIVDRRHIQGIGLLNWSWIRFFTGVSGTLIGVILTLLVAAIAGHLILNSGLPFFSVHIVNSITWGLSFGFSFLVPLSILIGVALGLSNRLMSIKTLPNQSLRSAYKNTFLIIVLGVIAWLVNVRGIYAAIHNSLYIISNDLIDFINTSFGITASYLWYRGSVGFPLFLAGLIVISLFIGGLFIIQHSTIRFLLFLIGYIPWNYAAFLDHCVDIGILRKVGGGYIFRHRYLLEYFAGQELK